MNSMSAPSSPPRKRAIAWLDRHAATLAAVCCLGAIAAFSAAASWYQHAQHPLALLGVRGMPHALAFNLLAFIVPGLLVAWTAVRLRSRLPAQAGRSAGVGAWLLAISGLAFAGQGVWALDPADLDGLNSQRHATAWLLWWLAFVPAALALWGGTRAHPGWQRWAACWGVAGAAALLLNLMPSAWLPGPIAQRAMLLVWLAGGWLASRPR